jgi:ribosomal protein S18 acetylase RimI-like enzyme
VAEASSAADEPLVRRATAADLDEMMALWRDLNDLQAPWRVFPPRPRVEEDMRRSYERAVGDRRSILLVAVRDGRVVGTAYGHPIVPSSLSDEPALELSSVVVAAEARGRRIGRALAAEVGRFAADQGLGHVVVRTFAENEEALGFWRAVGFRPRMVQLVAAPDDLAAEA